MRPQPARSAMTRPHYGLSLSDRQMALVKAAAASVPVQHRDVFLKQIAHQLTGQPGDLAVAAAINNALDRVFAVDNNTCH
jgi:hypothetical protein